MRRTGIALLTLILAFTLTACGAGFNASTREVKQVTDGVEASISTSGNLIKLRNIVVVETTDGSGVLVGTVINSLATEDALLGVAINGVVATVTGRNALPQNSPINFEGDSANAKATVPGLKVKAGQHVQVTMFFAHAGEITVLALVRDQSGDFASITA
jgi:predicted RecA/RadA family phage recombinase